MESPELPKMVNWTKLLITPSVAELRELLLITLPYEITIEYRMGGLEIVSKDVEEMVEKEWTVFVAPQNNLMGHFFFELETDAVAFKLRWME